MLEEIQRTLTVKLNSGPMSSSVFTAVITGTAASATKKLILECLGQRNHRN